MEKVPAEKKNYKNFKLKKLLCGRNEEKKKLFA
jgi:hypothetical protein